MLEQNHENWRVENQEMLAASKVKVSSSKQKANRNTSNKTFGEHIRHFLHKMGTRKFHDVVVQNNIKEMYKKVCCTCKVVFLTN